MFGDNIKPFIRSRIEENQNLILAIRILTGLIWGGTVFRRLLMPNFSDFELRIIEMSQGSTLYPEFLMNWAIENWFYIFLIVLFFEIISSISLLAGFLGRAGAFVATINGFAIGLAGIGLGLIDLIIPWSVAILTLILVLFTHPGVYFGLDKNLKEKNLPSWINFLM